VQLKYKSDKILTKHFSNPAWPGYSAVIRAKFLHACWKSQRLWPRTQTSTCPEHAAAPFRPTLDSSLSIKVRQIQIQGGWFTWEHPEPGVSKLSWPPS